MASEVRIYPKHLNGQIVEDGNVKLDPSFDYIHVFHDEDDINIDIECREGKLKDSYINISLSVKHAEILIHLLQQEIAEFKKELEE